MSIFGSIMEKIFHHGATPAAVPPSAATPVAPAPAAAAAASPAVAPAPAVAPVDVGAVLTELAAQKGGQFNWQVSIVDLLRLLDMDSSLNARKTLADELNVHVGADGSAEENIALHKAVMQKLADHGGTIPAELRQ